MQSFSWISKKAAFVSLLILGVLIFASVESEAKAVPRVVSKKKALLSRETIRTYDELMQLSEKERGMYIVGVEGLVNALADSDKDFKTEYQTADARWDLIDSILGVANAADNSDRRCIYAGSVSEMDINGRYCMRPLNQGCPGKITCNPLLYGDKQCVAGGSQAKYASRNCAEKAKNVSLSKIVKSVEGKREEWEAFRKELSGYCESPRPSQKGLCLTIKARVSRIEAILPSQAASEPAAPAPEQVAAPAPAEVAPPAPAPAAPSAGVRIAPSSDDAPLAVRAVPRKASSTIALTPTAGGSVAAVTGAGRICSRSFLLGDLKNDNDTYTYGLNLMSIGEAQDMMCTNGEISKAWIDEVRKMLRYKLSQIGSVPPRYRNNEKSEIEKVSANFEACLAEALAIRAGKTYSDPYPNGGTIAIGGYQPGVASFKQDPKSITANFTNSSGVNLGMVDVGHMGAWIEEKQISICRVKIAVRDVNNPEERNAGRPQKFPGARSGSGN